MKVMVAWTVLPEGAKEAVGKFLSGVAEPPADTRILGRWHRMDGKGGYTLYEASDPAQVFRAIVRWAGLIEFDAPVVMEDHEAGPVLAEEFKK